MLYLKSFKILILLKLLIFVSVVNFGCSDNKSSRSEISTNKFTKSDFKTEQKIREFFDNHKGKSISEIKAMLWTPREEFEMDQVISIWYSFDNPPFTELKKSPSSLVLGGFTLNFKDKKLTDYDLDFR